MPVDFSATPDDHSTSDAPMFAPIPSWERGKTRRGFGGKRPAAAVPSKDRSVAPHEDSSDLRRPTRDTVVVDEPMDVNAAPLARPEVRKSSNILPFAIAAGIVVIGGLGAAGYYAAQPRTSGGMAQLTPGQRIEATTPTMVAPGASLVGAEPQQPAASALRAPIATAAATPRTVRAPVRHSAGSRSVNDAAVNTSATLPSAPQPYSGTAVNPASATPVPEPAIAAPVDATVTPPEPASPSAVTPPTPTATPPTF